MTFSAHMGAESRQGTQAFFDEGHGQDRWSRTGFSSRQVKGQGPVDAAVVFVERLRRETGILRALNRANWAA